MDSAGNPQIGRDIKGYSASPVENELLHLSVVQRTPIDSFSEFA